MKKLKQRDERTKNYQRKAKFYETSEFKRLKNEWYDILKEDGFVDIEDSTGMFVSRPALKLSLKMDRERETNESEYFRLAGQFLFRHKFRGHYRYMDKYVWALHCEGETVRGIREKMLVERADKWWPKGISGIHASIERTKTSMLKELSDFHDREYADDEI